METDTSPKRGAESTELKTGQTATYEIAGRKLILTPLPLGKLKNALAALTAENKPMLEVVTEYAFLLLANGKNEGLTKEWMEENVSLPQAQDIVEGARRINGLEDFFARVVAPQKEAKALPAEPEK